MEYTKTTLAVDDVLILLQKCDNEFSPALSSTIDLEQYSQKLSKFAQFILAFDKEQTIGFVAYYLNEKEKFIYVPLIWVSKTYQRKGIGKYFIHDLRSLSTNGFSTIQLEVLKTNTKAAKFYKKDNFVIIEDRDKTWLLQKTISNDK